MIGESDENGLAADAAPTNSDKSKLDRILASMVQGSVPKPMRTWEEFVIAVGDQLASVPPYWTTSQKLSRLYNRKAQSFGRDINVLFSALQAQGLAYVFRMKEYGATNIFSRKEYERLLSVAEADLTEPGYPAPTEDEIRERFRGVLTETILSAKAQEKARKAGLSF